MGVRVLIVVTNWGHGEQIGEQTSKPNLPLFATFLPDFFNSNLVCEITCAFARRALEFHFLSECINLLGRVCSIQILQAKSVS